VSSGETETTRVTEAPKPPDRTRPAQPASKANIQAAIEQVNDIICALKESLEQMDEVLESLEYFERQGDADEREIESLRRSLRQLQRSREGGQHSHRGHS
jgi:predicted RNase H-like nuclease (RuvC/YqgF family)